MASFFAPPSQDLALLQSYRRMGLNNKNIEGYRAKMAKADRMRAIAMDPNKSKSMTEEEKAYYLNLPNALVQSVGGFEAETATGGAKKREGGVRRAPRPAQTGTMAPGASMTRASTPRLSSYYGG